MLVVVVAKLNADYLFISNPDVENDLDGTYVTSNGERLRMAKAIPMNGTQSVAFILSEDRLNKDVFKLVYTLYPETLKDEELLKLLPEILTGEKVPEKKVMETISALAENSEISEIVKFEFTNCFSREIYGQERWEEFFYDLFIRYKDASLVNSFLPLLCRNGVEFHSRIKPDSTLTDIMLLKIIRYSMYNDKTRHIFIEGLKREAPEVNFATLDILRGSADKYVVDAIKNLALSEDPRIQWAALMCLSTALERPVETPSLKDYVAQPQNFFDTLAPILLK